MKFKKMAILLFFFGALIGGSALLSCSGSQALVTEKTGAQLWGENCVRCHNAPTPPAFNDYQWETIAVHMRVRASLTEEEVNKIVEFLKMAN